MTLTASQFRILQTAKDVVRKMSKKPISEYRLTVNLVKGAKHC